MEALRNALDSYVFEAQPNTSYDEKRKLRLTALASNQKRIFDELLGLPGDVVPIGLALIGRPGDDPPLGSRLKERQRAQDDLVHWQRW